MTKKSLKAEANSFVKGFITEASPLNFPEGASLDEENFELSRKGTRSRRLGLDYEPNFLRYLCAISPNDISPSKISTGTWENVGGVSGKNYLVVNFTNKLSFFDLSTPNLSADGFVDEIVIETVGGSDEMNFTSVGGKLVVANGRSQIAVVDRDFNIKYHSILTRDLWGVDTGDALVDNAPYSRPVEPGEFNVKHRYNLYNQGWGVPRRGELQAEGEFVDPVEYFKTQLPGNRLPSNAETVWTAISMKAAEVPYERLRANAWEESFGTNPTAAKGYFIIDALYRGNGRHVALYNNQQRHPAILLGGFPDVPADVTYGGAKIAKEFAGRVFYAGFPGEVLNGDSRSPSLSNYIFFSQLVKSENDIVKCYQEGDPTSREGNDIVDTDGGFIPISGLRDVVALVPLYNSLAIIGSNGVWMLSGGSDYGFSATNYKVDQISDFGCVARKSVVVSNNNVVFWGEDGIYQIGKDQMGSYGVQSITDAAIQTYYQNISPSSKRNVVGCFDAESKTLRWVFSDDFTFDGEDQHELVLDSRIPAFYKYRIKNLSRSKVGGVFPVTSYQEEQVIDNVFVDSVEVLVGDDKVEIPYVKRIPSPTGVRYLMLSLEFFGTAVYYSFGYYNNGSFKDWYSLNVAGKDAKAFLLTGPLVGGDSSVIKQSPYLTVHMERTETGFDVNEDLVNPSGCLMRSIWGWSDNESSKKWSPLYQVYRYTRGFIPEDGGSFDTGFPIITTKNKLRGRGKAVSIYFETEEGKDCKLLGWNLNVNGNAIT